MYPFPDLPLSSSGPVSEAFLASGIRGLHAAFDHVYRLPYRRNSAKNDLRLVLHEGCGTCSSKHALLVTLAQEQGIPGFAFVQCLFLLDEQTVPGIGELLAAYGLEQLPEVHNFIRYRGQDIDVTSPGLSPLPAHKISDLKAVPVSSIEKEKAEDHRRALAAWKEDHSVAQHFSTEKLWEIRERCIARLQELL